MPTAKSLIRKREEEDGQEKKSEIEKGIKEKERSIWKKFFFVIRSFQKKRPLAAVVA